MSAADFGGFEHQVVIACGVIAFVLCAVAGFEAVWRRRK